MENKENEIKIIKKNKKEFYKKYERFNNIKDSLKYLINNLNYNIKEINLKKENNIYIMDIIDYENIILINVICKNFKTFINFKNDLLYILN